MKFAFSVEQLPAIFEDNWIASSGTPQFLGFNQISTDSRAIAAGDLFIALRGEQFDGHQFVEAALSQGAAAVIVAADYSLDSTHPIPHFTVKNTLRAYQQLGHWWRKQLNLPIIAVTGSVGKTTTKELIAGVLSRYGNVHKTQANFNNEIGVPKTLLALEADHDYGVIEFGMRAQGEIAELTQIAEPNISVITNVGTAHIGRLGSEEAIAKAKCELLAEMPKAGIAILNHDNSLLLSTAAQVWSGKQITYGLEAGDIQGTLNADGTMTVAGIELKLPLPGRHNALNYLAALAVAQVLGLDWQSLRSGIAVDLPGGRSRRYELDRDIVLLDETYNAGLESMKAALHLLKETPGKRHIAVLGTMKELGARSPEFHRQIGETVQALGLDRLFVLIDDPEAIAIAQGAGSIPTECLTTPAELIARVCQEIQPGDRVLFKASNSVGLNKVVQAVLAEL